jgi:uncharacterized membrane protein
MKRLIDQSFEVAVPLKAAWDHLAQIEKWPSWAKHIKSVIRNPAGPLSVDTAGTINLSIGVATTFKMTELEPMRHWKWRGGLLGAQLDYDHVFTALAPARTRVQFTIDASGWQATIVGPTFAAIYRRNLRRAIPLLITEIEMVR